MKLVLYIFYIILDNLNDFHGILLFVDVSDKQVCCCGGIYLKTTWLGIRSSPIVISHCFDGCQLTIFFLCLLP